MHLRWDKGFVGCISDQKRAQRVRSEGDVVGESELEPEEVEKRGSSAVDPPRHDHQFAATSSRSSAISPADDKNSGDRSPKASDASLAGSEQRSTLPNGRDIDGGTSLGDGERRNGDTGLGNNAPTTPAPGPGEKRKRTTTSNGNADHPASKYPRPGSEINGSSSPSPPLPDKKASEDLPLASRSRKGKERAQDPEEPTKEVANIAKERVDAELRVKYDSSHASELALDEARQSGLSQEQLEAMATFCDPIRAAAEGYGAENPAGSSANVASPEQAYSSTLAQSQPPTDDGRRSIDDAQPSPPSREASPARTETDSNIPYDDGVHDDEQGMGGTIAGDSEQSGPTTPLPASGDKRKREPSSGSSERPATKHPRPGFQSEDESSPVPQSRLRSSRHDITLSLSRPVNGDGSNSEDRVIVSRTRFESLRSTNSIPEEETTPVAGGCSGLALARNPAGGTKDDAKELHTESQMGHNPTTPSQTPIQVATKPHRGLATRVQHAQELRGISASARPSLLSTMTTPAEGTPASPTAKGPAPRPATSLFSETREDGTCGSKPAYHVRITGTSAAEGSRPTVPGSPTEPSTIQAAVPNETIMVQHQVNGVSRSDQTATSARHPIESSRSGTTSDHTIDILGLLRGWRAAFINLHAGLLAEAGLRVIQPGASANQGIGVEQPVQHTSNQQAHRSQDYRALLLGVLNASRGVLSTVSPETLSTVGLEIIPWSARSAVLPSSLPLRGDSSSDSQEPNFEQFFAYLRDLMNSRSSMAPTPAPPTQPADPHMNGLDGVAVSRRTSLVNHDSGSRGLARRTQDAAVETDESSLPNNQAEVQSRNGLSSQATDQHANPPSSGLDITKTKTKPKTKNRKNKEKLDTDAPSAGLDVRQELLQEEKFTQQIRIY
ncbi:hypothetical protein FRC00_006902 [Tulasnella sp. 408]|nr:hypothetical protein FRC00_006902 [Tulasnella sp. 408]